MVGNLSPPFTECQNKGESLVTKTELRRIMACPPGKEALTLKGEGSAARALVGDS